MVNLSEKYQSEIAAIKADALANVSEAEKTVSLRAEAVEACSTNVDTLKDTVLASHKAFFDVIRALTKLAFMRNPSPEEVNEAIAPSNTYVVAATQLPVATQYLSEAIDEENCARRELFDARSNLQSISNLE